MTVHVMNAVTPEVVSPDTPTFLVLRQDPDSREYRWLGLLSRSEDEYTFRYTAEAASDQRLRPLPGFADRGSRTRVPVERAICHIRQPGDDPEARQLPKLLEHDRAHRRVT